MRVQFKRIICTTDFSDLSNRAIPYGIALAKEFKAHLYVHHVIALAVSAGYGEVIVDLVEYQNKAMEYALEQIAQIVGEQPIDCEPLISTGHIADEIARLAEEKTTDLVITATHGRSGLRRIVLGSVTERLVRTLPCPMLIIPGKERNATATHDFKLKRILIGCDFSEGSDLAFQYGLSLAQEFQSELHLVHVVAPPVYRNFNTSGTINGAAIPSDLREYLNGRLEEMIPEEAHNWCSPKTVLLDGKPDEELINYAVSNNMDLIALGVRGQGLVEKLFVGSTTERVIRRSSRPVLSVCAEFQKGSERSTPKK